MLNLKRLIKYIVVLVAMIIWGLVLFNLTSGLGGTMVKSEKSQPVLRSVELSAPPNLELNYRDPFHLEKKKKIIVKSKSIPLKLIHITELPKQTRVSWPELTYQGMIINRTKQRRMAVLIIEGKERIFKEGEVYEEMEIQRITADSIYCSKGNQFKTFNKSL